MNHTNQKVRLLSILSIAVAGAASMATSPPDGGTVPTIPITLEAAIPEFVLDDKRPEALFDVTLSSSIAASVSGQFAAEFEVEADREVVVVTTFDDGRDSPLPFSKQSIRGTDALSIDGRVQDSAVVGIRTIGDGVVSGGGKVVVVVQVAVGSSTSTAGFTLWVTPQ